MTARQYLTENRKEQLDEATTRARETQKIVSFKTVEEKFKGDKVLGWHRFQWFVHPDGRISHRKKLNHRRPWGMIYKETNLERKKGGGK